VRPKNLIKWAIAMACAGVLAAACTSGSSNSGTSGVPTGGTKTTGGTVTWAELPSATPNFIYPFDAPGFFSVTNISQFQYMMYRPLYWFGNGNQPTLNESESLAQLPTYSNNNQTVTINLKPYKWSDGSTLSSSDVMQWMNLWHAEKANWAAYVPNVGMPDDIASVTVNSPTQLTINLTGPANPTWLTYNNLSQITPFPQAWDITKTGGTPGSGGCSKATYGSAAADSACKAVWNFMTAQAGYSPTAAHGTNNSLATYATNPLWQVVDGPWKLSAFDPNGTATFVPNDSYSGPVKPTISKFVELPFTDESAELNALLGGQLTMGYLPLADVTKSTTNPLTPAPNISRLASSYYILPLYPWSINYFPYNFNSTGDNGNAGAIFSQLYIRQAIQYLVDQPLIVQKIYKGYGTPTYGPVPVLPANPYVSPEEKTNPYPYNPAKAKQLLSSHGWSVVPNGVDTCTRPGTADNECGKGIPAGAQLNFDLQYSTGVTTVDEEMSTERAAWASAGIKMNLSTASFDTVIGNATACTPGPSCTWQLENWGAGWIYAPDFYPTGEEIFSTGAVSNYGSYSDPTNDQNTVQTNTTNTTLFAYENYLAKQLPVIWQANQVQYLWEINTKLRGVDPVNVLDNNNPEYYYFVK
jgi:peptide/nickel transport system substrate-binding protein